MNRSPWPAIVSRVAGLALIGVPVGIWQDLTPAGWLLYSAFLVPMAALGGYASWWGARKAEERIAAHDGRATGGEDHESRR